MSEHSETGGSPEPKVESTADPVAEPVDESSNEPGFDVADLPGGLPSAIEAILMVVDEPITEVALAAALEVPVDDVVAALHGLESEYAGSEHGPRGFTLRAIAGGWRIYSRPDFAPVVEKFLLDGQQARLSQAALETLAVIAYKQPVSRARIGAIRGVNVDGVVRTLLTRGMIAEMDDPGESGAVLYGTTTYFLQRMGLSSLEELPPLAPYLPDAAIIDELAAEGLR